MKFEVLETGKGAQTATMILRAGESSGPKENEHAQSEQVLFLQSGELHAEVGERTFTMKPGDAVIVGINVPHRFENRGSEDAVTFNVYSPPAY